MPNDKITNDKYDIPLQLNVFVSCVCICIYQLYLYLSVIFVFVSCFVFVVVSYVCIKIHLSVVLKQNMKDTMGKSSEWGKSCNLSKPNQSNYDSGSVVVVVMVM